MAVTIQAAHGQPPLTIMWDSKQTRHAGQYRTLSYPITPEASLDVQYELHAYSKRQEAEQDTARRIRWAGALALPGAGLTLVWIFLVQHRERERERLRVEAQRQLDEAERHRLAEQLGRREAEQRHEEVERKLLEQRLATQAAEGRALELKSQLYASIGIMAGSYAHNIKNLLVRPNDLLRRCMEGNGLSTDQEYMLGEVKQTLGTVTERLQQILRTVHRDPSRSEMTRIDLNALVLDLQRTWEELAREKWKLILRVETCDGPLWVQGDLSHLQQAVENLLFNARDATFEMRNYLRDDARRRQDLSEQDRRQALIAATSWRGNVVIATRGEGPDAVLEVRDNGIGMTDEVRRRCTETHFSTKRDNALYEGNSTGMGLGLSFVAVILENHHARLDVDSVPREGAAFRIRIPLAATC
jgi:signal transduction histidine kinase